MREVELKFRVNPPFELPALVGTAGVARAEGPARSLLTADYYDTPDLRLAREQITLRYREDGKGVGGWTLKLPVLGAGAGTRDEIDAPGERESLPDQLRSLVCAHVRRQPLSAVATLVTDRSAYLLYDGEGTELAEVVDDTVEARDGAGHVAARFREIEVEQRTGLEEASTHTALSDLGAVLRSAGAVDGRFTPKVVRALGTGATAPPEVPPPPRSIARDAAVGDVVQAALRRHVRHLMVHDPLVRMGVDDAVHQMRVATRRLRSSLRFFRPWVDGPWSDELNAELRWLGEVLGRPRDAEVMLARLTTALGGVPPELVRGPVEARLQASLGAELVESVDAALAELSQPRYLRLVDALVAAARSPVTVPAADERADEALAPAVRKAWNELERRAGRARKSEQAADYHRARIAAKRARYATEAVSPVFGKQARAFAGRLTQVQDLLGEEHDATVAGEVLLRLAGQRGNAGIGFTLGILHATQNAAAQRARASFHERWPEVARRRHRRWMEC